MPFGSRLLKHNMVTYAGKLCLAPMVRSGELPTRLMALKYGADVVWSPEVIDKKIRQCERRANVELGTIDFVEQQNNNTNKPMKNSVAFRTLPAKEKGRLIFQIGSSDPDIAVEGALKVIQDVDGIDLNCGCPKPFSTHSGMGAALLKTPDLLTLILRNLVEKVGIPNEKPISAKIRLLHSEDPTPTLDLVEKICETGIANLTVHCRTPSMRNRDCPVRKFVLEIYEVVQKHGVSLVINGGFTCKKEIVQFQQSLNNPNIGGMIAEAAESNPSVFSDTPLSFKDCVNEFLQTCIDLDNHPSNTKYIVLNQIPGKLPTYQRICKVKSNKDFLAVAEEIGDEGDKIFVRTMQKDKLLDMETFLLRFDSSLADATEISSKRKSDSNGSADKKLKIDVAIQQDVSCS